MKSAAFLWLLILATLRFSLWLRYSLVEHAEFGFFCEGGGGGKLCALRWLTVQSFHTYGLGYLGLFLGALAALTRTGPISLLGGMAGTRASCSMPAMALEAEAAAPAAKATKPAPPAKPRPKFQESAECVRTGQRFIAALTRDDSGVET